MTGRSAQWLPRPLVVALGLAVSACTGGNATYGCPGLPGQPLCLPPSSIYALTAGQGPPPAAQRRPSTLRSARRPPCCAEVQAQDGAFGEDTVRTTTTGEPP